MDAEESSFAEFQEKGGLKRKLTGPPRLLLGKNKSPAQDEKKSDAQALRRQRRDKNNDVVEEHQGNNDVGCESQQVKCQSPQMVFSTEEGETHTDPQEVPSQALSTSEQSQVRGEKDKSRLRRCRAKATIRRVFSPAFMCVSRKKKDAEENATHRAPNNVQELLTLPGESFRSTERCKADLLIKDGTRKGKRKLHIRMWPVFKRLSAPSSSKQKHKMGSGGQDSDTFFEITSEKSMERSNSATDQADYDAPEPSGDKIEAEQLKGSSEIHEDMARIVEESFPGKDLEEMKEGKEKTTLNSEPSVGSNRYEKIEQGHSTEQDADPAGLLDSADPASVNESESDTNVPEATPYIAINNVVVTDLQKMVPIENEAKCNPVITIEDVHSSDEESQEPMESDAQQPNTLSPLVSVNGSCPRFKVNRIVKGTLQTSDHSNGISPCSEILLVQTAFSLVHAAISSAMEQLSDEQQSNQIDQDHA